MHRATYDTSFIPDSDKSYNIRDESYYLPQDVARKIRYADIAALRELGKALNSSEAAKE